MLLRSNGRLSAIGVMGEEDAVERIVHLVEVVGEVHVVFLIDGLELGVESSDDHIAEALCLHLGPRFQGMAWDVLLIAGDIGTRIGIGACGAYSCHHLVVFVGNGKLAGFVAEAVYAGIDGAAPVLVGNAAIHLILRLDTVEQRLLPGVVERSEARGTLEHEVLQVVCQAGALGWIVARTGPHRHISLYARFVVVHCQIHLEPVLQGIDVRCHGVISQHRFLLRAGVMARLAGCQRATKAECSTKEAGCQQLSLLHAVL